jgi:hypothetical protein
VPKVITSTTGVSVRRANRGLGLSPKRLWREDGEALCRGTQFEGHYRSGIVTFPITSLGFLL